jgi:hypothetical protein
VIGVERIGDAPARDFRPAQRPSGGIRVLSFTQAVAGPVVGRTQTEHGADVLCATRPNDCGGINLWIGRFAGACKRAVEDTSSFEQRAFAVEAEWRSASAGFVPGSLPTFSSCLSSGPGPRREECRQYDRTSFAQTHEAMSR